ncbi:hypothetical protein TL16_g03578 [Triparma laevis f. inornata]|uniref:Uncharacterized protein n=1 Tax=Triparma laevis f. inornata TaxID=1714386 RepID=A0A9W6ZYW8_9STRA|nr:hypothetical protein TL16_g03578 [Triparma laevis f. inornata]
MSSSIFSKNPRTGVHDCSVGVDELLGLRIWKKDGKGEWKIDVKLHSPSSAITPEKHSTPAPTSSASSQSLYKIPLKSYLLASSLSTYLTHGLNTPGGESGVLNFCRLWAKEDAKVSQKLSLKNTQAFYSNVNCTHRCFEVLTKFNSIRASGFGGCLNVSKRGKRGKKLNDKDRENYLEFKEIKENVTPPHPIAHSNAITPDTSEKSFKSFLGNNTPRDVNDCGAPQTPLFLKNMVFNNRIEDDVDSSICSESSAGSMSPGGVGGTILDFRGQVNVEGDALDFLRGSVEMGKEEVVVKRKKIKKKKKTGKESKKTGGKEKKVKAQAPPPEPPKAPPKVKQSKPRAPPPLPAAAAPPPTQPAHTHTIQSYTTTTTNDSAFDNTTLIQTLNKKCSELLLESKRADYESKLRADAESQLLELQSVKTSHESSLSRLNSKLQKSLSKTSKSETSLLRSNESLLQTKLTLKQFLTENEEFKSTLRELKGDKAGLEASLETERSERKRLKNQVNELKGALRKLSSLKASDEYVPSPSSQKSGDDTSPSIDLQTPTEMALTSQLNSLKNENVYLRRQVSSEIKCKKELEGVVERQRGKLSDFAGSLKKKEEEKILREAEVIVKGSGGEGVNAEVAQLTSENTSLKTELKSMTDCYKLSRSNVTLREKALQDSRTSHNLLEGELESLKIDLDEKERELDMKKEEGGRMEALYEMRAEECQRSFQSNLDSLEAGHEEVVGRLRNSHKSFKLKSAAVLQLTVIRSGQVSKSKNLKIDVKKLFDKWRNMVLKQRLKETEASKLECESQLKTKVEDVTEKFREHDKRLRSEMKGTLKEKDGKIAALREDQKILKLNITNLKTELSKLIKSLESSVENKTSEIERVQEESKNEVTELQLKISNLNTSISQNEENQLRKEEEIKLSKSRLQFETEKRLEDSFKLKVERIESSCRKRVLDLEDRMRSDSRTAREREDSNSKHARERESKVRIEGEEEGERRGVRKGREEGRKEVEEDFERKAESIKMAMGEKIEILKIGLEEKSRTQVLEATKTYEKEKEEREKKYKEEIKEVTEKMECEGRVKIGEERARSSRVVERVREEAERAAESKTDEVAARLKVEYDQKMLELEAGHKSGLDDLAISKKNALIKEAQKWETALENAVEEGEKRRIEEIRSLSSSGREEAESSRRKIAAAAKKAIEEARRRFLSAKAEFEKAEQEKATLTEEKKNLEALINTMKMEVDSLKQTNATVQSDLEVKSDEVTTLSDKITDLEDALETTEASKSLLAEKTEITIKRLEDEVEELETLSARKYAEGVLRGKDTVSAEMKQKESDFEAEKEQMLKSLKGYKERARVWDLQAERLDKDLEEKKKECEELQVMLELAKKEAQTEKLVAAAKDAELVKRTSEFATSLTQKEAKFKHKLHETVNKKVSEVSELAAKESSKTISTFERRITVLQGEKNLAVKETEKKINSLLTQNEQSQMEAVKLNQVVADVRDAIVELSGKNVWEGIDEVDVYESSTSTDSGTLAAAAAKITQLENEQAKIKSSLSERVERGKGFAQLIQETERALQQHSNGGSLSPGGTVSLSHVKASRRLNEELESHIKSIDGNRKQTKALTAELQAVNEKLVETERACRGLERREKYGVIRKLKMVAGVVETIVGLVDEGD